MKRCSFTSRQNGITRQKGVSLIEALIAVLLVGLMSQGAVYPVSYTHLTLPTIYSV